MDDIQNPVALNPEALPAAAEAPVPPSSFAIKMLQNDTDEVFDISQDDADVAVRSGLYSPLKTDEFVVVDKYDELHRVNGENLRQALQDGLRLETSQQRYERELQERYGDQDVTAAVEGAGRGLLAIPAAIAGTTADKFMSDLDQSLGGDLTEQELQQRAEANPISSVVGNVVGSLAGLNRAGVGKLATGAEKAVAKAVLKDAAKAGVSKRLGAALAAKAAAGAVEGTAYGVNDLLSENSLGKADVNAENLMAAATMGAVLGGTVGGAIGGVGQLVSEGVQAASPLAKSVLKPLQSQVSHAMDADMSSARLLGLTPNQFQKLKGKNPNIAKDIQGYLKDDLQLAITDTAEDLLAKNTALKESAGKRIGGVLDEIDVVLKDRPDLKPSAKAVWGNVYNKVFSEFEEILTKDVGPGVKDARRKLEKFLDEVRTLEKSGDFNASQLQKIKKTQDNLLNWEKAPGKWTQQEEMLYSVRNAIKSEIDLLADNLQKQGLSGNLGAELKAANKQYAGASAFGDYIESRALKSADRDFSFMNSVRESGLDISRKMVVLGKIQKAADTINKITDKAVDNFFAPVGAATKSAVKSTVVPVTVMTSEFGKNFEDGKYKKPKDKAEAYNNMQKNFERYGADPEAFMNRVNRSTAFMYNSAPETSTALDTLAVRGAVFLGSKMPKRTTNPGAIGFLKPAKPPSQFDLAKFERYLTAVEKPETVFKALEDGRMSHEAAEALKVVYPNLFQKLQEKVMKKVMQTPNLPYNKKLQLGLLFDIPADESLLPQNVMGLQSMFAPQQPDQSGVVNPTQTGLNQLNSSERAQTDTERVATET